MTTSLARLLPLASLLFVLGCGSAIKEPTASVRSGTLRQVTENGLALDFVVDVANPNGFAVPVSSADYKLAVGGVRVLSDSAKPADSIPANGSAAVTVPVTLKFEDLIKAEQALAQGGGNVPYAFDGSLAFSAGPLKQFGQSVRVPIKYEGTLPLRDIARDPVTLLKSPAGRRIIELVVGKSGLGGLLGR
ncbi:MAG TPA: LEA type 2 family protein [Humisphaera sp.]